MNQINVIAPYPYMGQWVFDDEEKGLQREALIAGIDEMLDVIAEDYPNGFIIRFSREHFPTFQYRLEKIADDPQGGTWYQCQELELQGWLCPALLRYFDVAPQTIYVQPVEEKDHDNED